MLLAIAAVLLALRVLLSIQEARVAPAEAGPGPAVDRVHWRTLAEGLAESRTTGRPLLFDFAADWCMPCQLMQREIFADPQAAAALDLHFVPVRVLDRTKEEGRNPSWVDSLQARFHVNAFPTLIVARPDGDTSVRIEGYMGRDFTLGRIEDARGHLRMEAILPSPGRAR